MYRADVQSDGVIELLEDVRGLLVMLKVYFDLGAKSDNSDGVVTVAAAMFRAETYRNFIRVWRPMVRRWGAEAFHATDFYNGAREFWRLNPDGTKHPERMKWFEQDCYAIPTMIGANAIRLVAIGFRPKEFLSLASDAFKSSYGTSLHSMATQLILIANGWWAKDVGYDGKFACFMESGDDDSWEVEDSVRRMKLDGETGRHIQVQSFTTIDKGEAHGLEAADCVAWHWNKYYMDYFRHGKEDQARKDFAAMMHIAAEDTYMSLMVGDKLKYYLSLAPLPDGASGVASSEAR
jgi:hypothetical protein